MYKREREGESEERRERQTDREESDRPAEKENMKKNSYHCVDMRTHKYTHAVEEYNQ